MVGFKSSATELLALCLLHAACYKVMDSNATAAKYSFFQCLLIWEQLADGAKVGLKLRLLTRGIRFRFCLCPYDY